MVLSSICLQFSQLVSKIRTKIAGIQIADHQWPLVQDRNIAGILAIEILKNCIFAKRLKI